MTTTDPTPPTPHLTSGAVMDGDPAGTLTLSREQWRQVETALSEHSARLRRDRAECAPGTAPHRMVSRAYDDARAAEHLVSELLIRLGATPPPAPVSFRVTVRCHDGSEMMTYHETVLAAWTAKRAAMDDLAVRAKSSRITYADGSALAGHHATKLGALALRHHGFPFRTE